MSNDTVLGFPWLSHMFIVTVLLEFNSLFILKTISTDCVNIHKCRHVQFVTGRAEIFKCIKGLRLLQ